MRFWIFWVTKCKYKLKRMTRLLIWAKLFIQLLKERAQHVK